MSTTLSQAHYAAKIECGLCHERIHLEYPPLIEPGMLDGERLGTIVMLHVRYGCRATH